MDIIKKLKQTSDVKKVIDKLSLDKIEEIIKILNEHYFENSSLIDDNKYDEIIKYIDEKYPNNNITNKIGYEPLIKVKLPYYMGSENKLYDNDSDKLKKWLDHYGTEKIIVSAKADGISALWDINNKKLYTRGNGKFGKDISWFIKYLENSNMYDISNLSDYVIRGELVINIPHNRNDVSGAINSLESNRNKEILEKIYFVGYEILNPRFSQKKQFKILKKNNFPYTPGFTIEKENISIEYLNDKFQILKSDIEYEIDGLIIRNDNINPPIDDGNPPWSIAYKPITNIYKVTVIKVNWEISKQNRYIPIAEIEPIKIGNRIIKKVTCHNAEFVKEKGIGPNAVITIEYRGNVIPKLIDVIEPVNVSNDDLPEGEMIDKHLYATSITKESSIKVMSQFFKILNIQVPNKKVLEKLYDAGITTIIDLLKCDLNEILDNTKKQNKNTIQSVNIAKSANISIPILISALSIPYLTEKVLIKIYNEYNDFLTCDRDFTKIKGISKIIAEKVKENLSNNKDMIREYLDLMNPF